MVRCAGHPSRASEFAHSTRPRRSRYGRQWLLAAIVLKNLLVLTPELIVSLCSQISSVASHAVASCVISSEPDHSDDDPVPRKVVMLCTWVSRDVFLEGAHQDALPRVAVLLCGCKGNVLLPLCQKNSAERLVSPLDLETAPLRPEEGTPFAKFRQPRDDAAAAPVAARRNQKRRLVPGRSEPGSGDRSRR
jgi:hypothetical protein